MPLAEKANKTWLSTLPFGFGSDDEKVEFTVFHGDMGKMHVRTL